MAADAADQPIDNYSAVAIAAEKAWAMRMLEQRCIELRAALLAEQAKVKALTDELYQERASAAAAAQPEPEPEAEAEEE